MPGYEGFDGDFDGGACAVFEEEGVFGCCAPELAEVGEGLESAEVEVYRLPEEEAYHPDQGREEAVKEVGR